MSNIENPQSLMKLSMSVGLYTTKVTTDFWRVFGVTVLECVRKQSLKR